jgi:phosphate transport system substrate-binding protein
MKRFALIGIFILSAIVIATACITKEAEADDDIDPQLKVIDGFTFDNYPKVYSSTSAGPLNVLIACKSLGIRYKWEKSSHDGSWNIEPILKGKENKEKFQKLVRAPQTHYSFINLIDKKADIILSARKMSPDEKTYAEDNGVSLIETPIALDAFVFIVNPENPITTLTVKQIQDIYTKKITNWNEVGGNDMQIQPFVRNENSGSQELMESMVMKDFGNLGWFPRSDEVVIQTMTGAIERVQYDINSICYTVYYFKEHILIGQKTKTIAIEGIYPNAESINVNSYPLVAEVYAVIRSDLDKSSTAYKLYEFLQTEKGKKVISESGYLPN